MSRTHYPLVHVDPSTAETREQARQKMLAACQDRFESPEFDVTCDKSGTVWVKDVTSGKSFGMQPWQLASHSVDECLERATEKLAH